MIQTAISKLLQWKWKHILADQEDPVASQEKAFISLQRQLSKGQMGRAIGIGAHRSYQDFITQTPAFDYTDFAGWIQGQLQGQHPMYSGKTEFIGLSSGTTGSNSKKILYNRPMVRSFENFQKSVAAILERHYDVKILRDPRLSWGSTPIVDFNAQGIAEGYVSGFLSSRAPRSLSRSVYPSIPTQMIPDMREKTQLAAEELKGVSLKLISGVPSYIISLLEDLKQTWGVSTFEECWPQLQTMIYSATAINCYKEPLERLIGRPLNYLGLYASTEGAFGYEIPFLNNGENGLYSFHFGSILYGFRRVSDDRQLSIADLAEGDEVELLISSPNGFTQYRTGDVLRIRSISPTILFEILGRVGHGLNVATEKVSLSQLQSALTEVSQATQIPFKHFFVYPSQSENGKPCYEWALVPSIPSRIDLNSLTEKLDSALKRQNGDYRENREDLHFLGTPKVQLLPESVIKTYFKKFAERGQLKMKTTFDSKSDFESFIDELMSVKEVA